MNNTAPKQGAPSVEEIVKRLDEWYDTAWGEEDSSPTTRINARDEFIYTIRTKWTQISSALATRDALLLKFIDPNAYIPDLQDEARELMGETIRSLKSVERREGTK